MWFQVQEAHLKNFIRSIIPILQKHNHLDVKYDCGLLNNSDDTTLVAISATSGVHADLLTAIHSDPLLFIDSNNMTIRYVYSFTGFTTSTNVSMDQASVATIKNGVVNAISGESIRPTRRYFRVGIVEASPWSYIVRDKYGKVMLDDNHEPIWDGYCIEFARKLADRMEYDFEFVVPKTGQFGRKYSEDKWDGLIGDLYTGDTDLIVAPLKMTAQREEVIDFVTPFFEQTGILIMMRNPVVETSLFKFMTVLRLEVWLSIIAALVATSIMLWLLDTYSPYSSRNNQEAYPYPCR